MVATKKFLGIEIGGTKLQIVCGHGDGTVLTTHRFVVNKEEGAAGIRQNIEATLKEYGAKEIAAVGVGFGGPVNRLDGTIQTSFHVEGWSGFSIGNWIHSLLEVPVYVDNDANVAALGEALVGAGRWYSSVLYITMGSGVGGGLVVDGEIYHGDLPGELEIGHLQMDRNGTTLQDLCSGWAVDEKIRGAVAAHPNSTLAALVKGHTASEAIFLGEALQAGDPAAREILEQTTDDFAYGLSHAIHLLHPQVVVLGGGLSFLGDVLLSRIQAKLPRYLMRAFAPGPPVLLTELKEGAVPVGALSLCNQQINEL